MRPSTLAARSRSPLYNSMHEATAPEAQARVAQTEHTLHVASDGVEIITA